MFCVQSFHVKLAATFLFIASDLYLLFLRTENLILASDPDREGEAIAWHIIEMLQQQNALPENINIA